MATPAQQLRLRVERTQGAQKRARPEEAFDWLVPYVWLEMYSWIALIVLAVILALSNISYMHVLDIPLWYAPQIPVAGFAVSINFFLGRASAHAEAHESYRPLVAMVYTLVMALASAVVGVVFIILKCVYVASSKCVDSDPTTICGGHLSVFVVLMCFCGVLVVINALLIWGVVKIWRSRPAASKSM